MIRIRTLGGLSVSRDGTPIAGSATQPRRLAVLALVARAGDRGIKRERVLSLLWPDTGEEPARAALSQTLHVLRRDLGTDELFLGVQDLRLNQAVATCDALEFEAAMASGDVDRAVAVYGGAFLEGFRLPGSDEVDRWIEEERANLAARYAEGIERLGRAATERGDAIAAAGWWRRRVAIDPLNARATVALMKALDAAGERAAAIQQARIYEALLEQELALEPDAAVVRLAAELRARTVEAVEAVGTVEPVREAPERSEQSQPPQPTQPTQPTQPSQPTRRAGLMLAIAVITILGAILFLRRSAVPASAPFLAVGTIRDFRDSASDAASLADMLATNLARVPGLQVVSPLRLLELEDRHKGSGDGAISAAARAAGATELVEGGIHPLAEGRLLLELRRMDLSSGAVRSAYRIEGTDLFELVASATRDISSSLGRPGDALDPGEVSTRSLVSYRFYEEGLREYSRGDYEAAYQLFSRAVREDSTFAMAEHYRLWAGGLVQHPWEPGAAERLVRLADRASDRERLLIKGYVAIAQQGPGLLAVAETLAVRYPRELDGHYLVGFARMVRGEFGLAIPHLQRVLELDSTGASAGSARCMACDAYQQLSFAYHALDSTDAASTVLRRWIARDSTSSRAWTDAARVAAATGRPDEAITAWRRAKVGATGRDEFVFPAGVRIIEADFAGAEELLRAAALSTDPSSAFEGTWYLGLLTRHQGRWAESARLMQQRSAALTAEERRADFGFLPKTAEALALYESGEPARAFILWDSIAQFPNPALGEGDLHRRQAMLHALLADAALALDDTSRVRRAADSAAAWASRSNNPRDSRVADHAAGVLRLAHGDTAGAISTLRSAIFSVTLGFTRTNSVLGRILLAAGRPAEAIAVVRPALRGSLESSNLYVTHTELHEQLGRAFTALGQRDSARVHFGYVAKALERSDPVAKQRLEAARRGAQ